MNYSLNLTCQQTHILAWANADQTLSLKINGQKFLGLPKVDKKGSKYWKVDRLTTSTNSSSSNSLKPTPVTKTKLDLNKPIEEFTKEEIALWQAQQATKPSEKQSFTSDEYLAKLKFERIKENIEDQSQKVLEQLAQNITNHNER